MKEKTKIQIVDYVDGSSFETRMFFRTMLIATKKAIIKATDERIRMAVFRDEDGDKVNGLNHGMWN